MPNDEPEVINPPAFDELRRRAAEGPVVMLNLLDFKPDGGAERYREYGEAVTPLLERAGGEVLYAGDADRGADRAERLGPRAAGPVSDPPSVPRHVTSPEYLEIAHLRTESLERGELHPLDTAEV